MPKRSSKLDLNQFAKRIVDEVTGEAPVTPKLSEKNKATQELGRPSGKVGGIARAAKLTPERRSEIAKKAAAARWKAKQDADVETALKNARPKKRRIVA